MKTIVRKSRYHPSITVDEWKLVRSYVRERAAATGYMTEAVEATNRIHWVLGIVDALEDRIDALQRERDEYKQLAMMRDRETWA